MPDRFISRDPFSRFTLYKKAVRITGQDERTPYCSWCGSPGKRHKRHRTLFAFVAVSDWNRESRSRYLYCSVSCFRILEG